MFKGGSLSFLLLKMHYQCKSLLINWCKACGNCETLHHVLNNFLYTSALEQGWYRWRHINILLFIVETLKSGFIINVSENASQILSDLIAGAFKLSYQHIQSLQNVLSPILPHAAICLFFENLKKNHWINYSFKFGIQKAHTFTCMQ